MLEFGRLITAMVTPFKEDGSLDLETYGHLVEGLIDAGNDSLLATGTTGRTLNEAEIKQARAAAKKKKWIRPANEILKQADALFAKDKKKEAAKLYRLLADIPLLCPETARAKKRSR